MSAASELPNLAALHREAGNVRGLIRSLRMARIQSLDPKSTDKQRMDAYHLLSVHEPLLYEQARELELKLEALLYAGRGDFVSVPRYWRSTGKD